MISTPALEGRAARQRMPRGYRQVSSPELSSQTALFSGVRVRGILSTSPNPSHSPQLPNYTKLALANALNFGDEVSPVERAQVDPEAASGFRVLQGADIQGADSIGSCALSRCAPP